MPQFAKCDLTFVCRRSWDDLQDTNDSHVRYCTECDKGVFPVRTPMQLQAASAVGRCVALTDDNEIVGWIGEPDFDWMEEESEAVAIRAHQPVDADSAKDLRLAFPKLTFANEQYCPGTWIEIGTFSERVAATLEADIRAQFPEFEIRERHSA